MRPSKNRYFAFLVLGLLCLAAVYNAAGEWCVYSPFLDTLFPILRPAGSTTDQAFSFMFPMANYFGVAVPSRPDKARYSLVIDLDARTLTLYLAGQPLKTYPVAVGKPETPTPVGEWMIISKSLNWGGGFGTRWLGLNVPWGSYGIHGTDKGHDVGAPVTGGCIRMFNNDVEELFRVIPVSIPVEVVGRWPEVTVSRALRSGVVGTDVQLLQHALRATGLDPGRIDGRFGTQTEQAVRDVEAFYGLEVDGVVDDDVMFLLGLRQAGQ